MDHIHSFCQTLYNCTYLPIHYYQDGKLELVLPDTGFPFDLAPFHLPELLSNDQPISYLVTKEFNYFGLIKNTETGQSILMKQYKSPSRAGETNRCRRR